MTGTCSSSAACIVILLVLQNQDGIAKESVNQLNWLGDEAAAG